MKEGQRTLLAIRQVVLLVASTTKLRIILDKKGKCKGLFVNNIQNTRLELGLKKTGIRKERLFLGMPALKVYLMSYK